jgi:rod shape-determining protein MreD
MRWLVFSILAYIAIGLQVGLSPYLRYDEGAPNFVLLAVIFIALNAPREPALLGAFLVGLLQDLMSTQGLGLYAFSYGLTAMLTISTQEIVYREHVLTHITLGLIGGLTTAVLLVLHGWAPWLKSPVAPSGPFVSAILTAVAAPIMLGVLQRGKRTFAFKDDPYRRYF